MQRAEKMQRKPAFRPNNLRIGNQATPAIHMPTVGGSKIAAASNS